MSVNTQHLKQTIKQIDDEITNTQSILNELMERKKNMTLHLEAMCIHEWVLDRSDYNHNVYICSTCDGIQ
jgi:hypothetical protein